MLPFRYVHRCGHCRTTSRERFRSLGAAEEKQQQHRDEFHGGDVPDHDYIVRIPFDRSRRRGIDTPYVSAKFVLIVLALLLLAALNQCR
ncbi:hypothetical protein ABR737_00990 [Streptomyces sp. Edi2]|uniref:hypothetical protein n=1 Tax=Streptomyces sp. Edi2 TaxID=3162528 RepID=UPI0033061BA2